MKGGDDMTKMKQPELVERPFVRVGETGIWRGDKVVSLNTGMALHTGAAGYVIGLVNQFGFILFRSEGNTWRLPRAGILLSRDWQNYMGQCDLHANHKPCQVCREFFYARTRDALFCSDACRQVQRLRLRRKGAWIMMVSKWIEDSLRQGDTPEQFKRLLNQGQRDGLLTWGEVSEGNARYSVAYQEKHGEPEREQSRARDTEGLNNGVVEGGSVGSAAKPAASSGSEDSKATIGRAAGSAKAGASDKRGADKKRDKAAKKGG